MGGLKHRRSQGCAPHLRQHKCNAFLRCGAVSVPSPAPADVWQKSCQITPGVSAGMGKKTPAGRVLDRSIATALSTRECGAREKSVEKDEVLQRPQ